MIDVPSRNPARGDGVFPDGGTLPLILDVSRFTDVDALASWLSASREALSQRLSEHGALLFRGYTWGRPEDFEAFAQVLMPDITEHHYFDDIVRPRIGRYCFEVADFESKKGLPKIAKWVPLPFHNEDSFVPHTPRHLMFGCLDPATRGGETSLVDCRRVLADIPERTLTKLESVTLPLSFTMSLKTLSANFGIDDRAQLVAEVAKVSGSSDVAIVGDNILVKSHAPAIVRHPETGERLWFNRKKNEAFFAFILDALQGSVKSANLLLKGRAVAVVGYFALARMKRVLRSMRAGDPHGLDAQDYWNLCKAYWKNSVAIPWQRGDFVIIDNWLVAHGRMPFVGRRHLIGAVSTPVPIA